MLILYVQYHKDKILYSSQTSWLACAVKCSVPLFYHFFVSSVMFGIKKTSFASKPEIRI
jgi:hypothetical protein